MVERPKLTADSEITAEACAWVAQIESGDLSSADLLALREWINRSPAHTREIRAVAALSGQLSILTDMAEVHDAAAAMSSRLRRPAWRRGGAALAALGLWIAVAAGLVAMLLLRGPVPPEPTIYATGVGEYRTVALEDGSVVKLNTDSRVEVDYQETRRRIRLVNGEALFEVASDPDRPFVVFSGDAAAEAVGTAFAVRLREGAAELAVIEGAVAFYKVFAAPAKALGTDRATPSAEKPDRARAAVIVRAGQTLLSSALPDDAGAPAPAAPLAVSPRELQRRLSWTEGLFDFSETPLEEVVAEIARHNRVRIEFADDELRSVKFGGIFRTGDLDALLEALERMGIEVEQPDEGRIILRKADGR
ncbi:FecR family protein [Amphiplicatus metriothermophilus]|uniref:FecR family protein n=1 Tax=Amphiplicatus metriothermophilus TaxID=1519374 RepID=A0A239PR07_9PROT|nr:FecR domain-containing protein [Amphiplicatus metriothermophilus]MBB5518686.1 transmembrane sensor [Amphiplicatus metriothermophilus]SNT72157.1 FecR family protein [Amphiplicatus metriothermophilus]